MAWSLMFAPAIETVVQAAEVQLGAAEKPSADDLLMRRGFVVEGPGPTVEPPPDAEVDEYLQTDSRNNKELVHYRQWEEPFDGGLIQGQLLSYPAGQKTVAFWLMRNGGRECTEFGSRTYNPQGRVITSSSWLRDPALQFPGAADFPPDLLPSWVPNIAIIHALENPSIESAGVLHVQITPYSVGTLEVLGRGTETIKVPAGQFSAIRIVMRADIKSFLPSWPSFVLKILQPLLHESTFFFQAEPPYRFLKSEGVPSFGGPEATTELVKVREAGAIKAASAN